MLNKLSTKCKYNDWQNVVDVLLKCSYLFWQDSARWRLCVYFLLARSKMILWSKTSESYFRFYSIKASLMLYKGSYFTSSFCFTSHGSSKQNLVVILLSANKDWPTPAKRLGFIDKGQYHGCNLYMNLLCVNDSTMHHCRCVMRKHQFFAPGYL